MGVFVATFVVNNTQIYKVCTQIFVYFHLCPIQAKVYKKFSPHFRYAEYWVGYLKKKILEPIIIFSVVTYDNCQVRNLMSSFLFCKVFRTK